MNTAAEADAAAERAEQQAAEARKLQAQYEKEWKEAERRSAPPARRTPTRTTRGEPNILADALGSRTGQTVVREVLRGIFSTLKRR